MLRGLAVALGFLTILPGGSHVASGEDVGRAAPWMPVVGLLMGALLAIAHVAFAAVFTSLVAASLTVLLWAALTGGLHLDGVADCGDGLLVTASPERRLEIMRDPRTGTFGVLAVVAIVLLKAAALASAPQIVDGSVVDVRRSVLAVLIAAPAIARWLMLWVARGRPARAGGMGAAFAAQITGARIAAGAIVPAALLVWSGYARAWWLVAALVVSATGVATLAAIARRRLGGVTGDVMGCAVEVAEVLVLVTWTARIGR